MAVSRPSAAIEFTVTTQSPLRRYEIYQRGAKIAEADKGDEVATDPQGHEVHTVRRELRLYPGINDLRVVAVNDGGAEEIELPPLSYIEAPITFEITGIELASKPGEIVAPRRDSDGAIVFQQAAADNLVYIHGSVSWNNQGERPAGIMAFVNEFQWPAVSVRETQANEAEFKIPALLNRQKNSVTLASTYDKDSALTTSFTLDCAAPAERTWLHLLVVGVGVQEKDREQLRRRALASLGSSEGQSGAGEQPSPVFERVFTYGPLVGRRLGAKDIHRELMQIDAGLQTRGPDTGRACDVVMLYYEGGDIVMTERGAGISTRPVTGATPLQLVEHTLTVAYLEHFVRRLQGAQVMLLDLARNASLPDETDLPTWRNKSRTALFRYVWLKKRDAAAEGSTLLSALRQLSPVIQLAELDAELNRIAASDSNIEYEVHLPPDMRTLTIGP
jgi:hypothetical protein